MSYDIHLINPRPGTTDDIFDIGNFSSTLTTHLNYATRDGFVHYDGWPASAAAPHMAEAAARLLQANLEVVISYDYEDAVSLLVAIWRACREYPDHLLRIQY